MLAASLEGKNKFQIIAFKKGIDPILKSLLSELIFFVTCNLFILTINEKSNISIDEKWDLMDSLLNQR